MGRMFDTDHSAAWLCALSAVHIVAPTLGGDDAAKSTIISRLIDAAVDLRAAVMIQEADIGSLDFDDLWRPSHRYSGQRDKHFIRFPGPRDGGLIEIPTDFFSSADGWTFDHRMSNWREGQFVATRLATFRPASPGRPNLVLQGAGTNPGRMTVGRDEAILRRAVSGLRFRRVDIERLVAGVPLERQPIGDWRQDVPHAIETISASHAARVIRKKAPLNTATVDAYFRGMIASGAFETEYGDPWEAGVRARIRRDYADKMVEKFDDHPSPATIKRRVNRLASLAAPAAKRLK